MAITFTKLSNGNVIINNNGQEHNLGNTAGVRKRLNSEIIDIVDEIFGTIPIDWRDVTVPTIASQDELFTVLIEVFFFLCSSSSSGTDVNAIHDNVASEITLIPEKQTPAETDIVLIEDSEQSNVKKQLSFKNFHKAKTFDFVNLKFSAGKAIDYIRLILNKKFFDFGQGNMHAYGSYDFALWDIFDKGIKISPNILQLGTSALVKDWLTANVANDGTNITNDVTLRCYVKISLNSFENVWGVNKGIEAIKSRSTYKDYKQRKLSASWSTFISAAWTALRNELGSQIPVVPAHDGSDCWMTSVANNHFVAFPTEMRNGNHQIGFNNSEGYNRNVWNETDGAWETINNILNNFADPLFFSNEGSIVCELNNNTSYNFRGTYPSVQEYAGTNFVRIYAFKSLYYSSTPPIGNKTVWSLVIKPLGMDYFYTSYVDTSIYSLYGMFWNNAQAKPVIRKIKFSDIIDSEESGMGWGVPKSRLLRVNYMLSHSHLHNGLNEKTIKKCSLFYMNEATGEISEPYGAIVPEVFKRGYKLGLKQSYEKPF